MKSRTALFLIAPALLAACATLPVSEADKATIRAHRLKPMSEREIRSRLVGRVVRARLDPGVITSPRGERYDQEGGFTLIQDRVSRYGSFEIKGSRLCTTLDGRSEQPQCRIIYKSPSGTIFMATLTSAGNLRQVEIE